MRGSVPAGPDLRDLQGCHPPPPLLLPPQHRDRSALRGYRLVTAAGPGGCGAAGTESWSEGQERRVRPSLGSGPGRGWGQERPPLIQPGERREGPLGATVRPPAWGSHGPLDGACPAWASSRCWRWGKQCLGVGLMRIKTTPVLSLSASGLHQGQPPTWRRVSGVPLLHQLLGRPSWPCTTLWSCRLLFVKASSVGLVEQLSLGWPTSKESLVLPKQLHFVFGPVRSQLGGPGWN